MCKVKKTPDDGQRNCPKHVEFYSKNKFRKLVHIVGFIIRIGFGGQRFFKVLCSLFFMTDEILIRF